MMEQVKLLHFFRIGEKNEKINGNRYIRIL
jgi:hypothetical protein